MAITTESVEPDSVIWRGNIKTMPKTSVWNSVYEYKIKNMVIIWNFEVIFDSSNNKICTVL
jgi:hypothetical protein